ncbi:MAG: hypothetical protein RhofKO_17240 [Rhodothermales bacterium]
MARVRQKGTKPELALRRALHAMGLRYRLQVPVLSKPRRVADIVFKGLKVAVFVDGCFWHGCPQHATWPKKNATFWREKIEANQARDADTNQRLEALGWTVIRIWAHELKTEEGAAETAARIADIVRERKQQM